MDMLKGEEIAEAELTDWRKLAQGLHARYLVDDFGTGARFVTAVGDTGHSATIAPVWAALLTGNAEAQGHGSPSDEIRDATGRMPNLWFGDTDEHETPSQRFHVEVYVAPEVAEQRIAAAVAAGGTVVDDSGAPSLTVIADQDGNTGVLCVAESPATKPAS